MDHLIALSGAVNWWATFWRYWFVLLADSSSCNFKAAFSARNTATSSRGGFWMGILLIFAGYRFWLSAAIGKNTINLLHDPLRPLNTRGNQPICVRAARRTNHLPFACEGSLESRPWSPSTRLRFSSTLGCYMSAFSSSSTHSGHWTVTPVTYAPQPNHLTMDLAWQIAPRLNREITCGLHANWFALPLLL